MTIHSYRVFYCFANDNTEYVVTVYARREAEARSQVISLERAHWPIVIVRVEEVK